MPTPENQQRLAQLQLAATLARVGGWRLDVSDNSMAWSDQLSAIYQIPQGSAPTLEHAVAFALPPWRPQVRALFDACARDGTPFDLEFQVAAGGRAYWTRIIGEAERDAGGAIVAVHGVLQDITAKYESDQLSFQRRFRELADAMPQVVWTADARGNVDFANSAWRTLTGVQKAELDSASWLEALHPDDVAMTLRAWEACVASGAPLQTEYRVRCLADGLYRWQLVQAQAIRDDDGVILRWYGSVTDIHDRKIDEEKMQSLANRLSMTLESITDALFTVDRYWRFSYVNYESERVLQRPRRELLGQEIWDAFPLFRGSRFESACREALEQLSTQSVEELYSPLGIWLEIRIYPFEDGLAVYYRDVRSVIAAPLRSGHEMIGVLKVLSDQPQAFSERDVVNMQMLVASLGSIIQRHRIAEQLRSSEAQYKLLFNNNPHADVGVRDAGLALPGGEPGRRATTTATPRPSSCDEPARHLAADDVDAFEQSAERRAPQAQYAVKRATARRTAALHRRRKLGQQHQLRRQAGTAGHGQRRHRAACAPSASWPA
jgi:PAS domain S-box-containing protein